MAEMMVMVLEQVKQFRWCIWELDTVPVLTWFRWSESSYSGVVCMPAPFGLLVRSGSPRAPQKEPASTFLTPCSICFSRLSTPSHQRLCLPWSFMPQDSKTAGVPLEIRSPPGISRNAASAMVTFYSRCSRAVWPLTHRFPSW